MDIMTKEESYADRRQLFKNIWEAAMQINEKDAENATIRPKVIKTLRLEEVDKCAGKRKKERIRNLRTVCRKILDFCDRQDADDVNEQNADDQERVHSELKRVKIRHRRKKIKKNSSLVVHKKSSQFERGKINDFPRVFPNNVSKYNAPTAMKRTTIVERTLVADRRPKKVKSISDGEESNALGKQNPTRRKVIRKRISKRKKSTPPDVFPQGPSGALNVRSKLTPVPGRTVAEIINLLNTGT